MATTETKPVIRPSAMKRLNVIFLFLACLVAGGCAQVTETAKVIWGSSTRALEEARTDAMAKTYRCSLDDCFDAVAGLARHGKTDEPAHEGFFDIFIKDRNRRHIVVMGIAGNVDTTEVGIFFTQPALTTVKLEISSLSSSAKRKVARAVFEELDSRFSPAE